MYVSIHIYIYTFIDRHDFDSKEIQYSLFSFLRYGYFLCFLTVRFLKIHYVDFSSLDRYQ